MEGDGLARDSFVFTQSYEDFLSKIFGSCGWISSIIAAYECCVDVFYIYYIYTQEE